MCICNTESPLFCILWIQWEYFLLNKHGPQMCSVWIWLQINAYSWYNQWILPQVSINLGNTEKIFWNNNVGEFLLINLNSIVLMSNKVFQHEILVLQWLWFLFPLKNCWLFLNTRLDGAVECLQYFPESLFYIFPLFHLFLLWYHQTSNSLFFGDTQVL